MSEEQRTPQLDFEELAFRYGSGNRLLLQQALEQTINRFCCEFTFSHAEVLGVLEIVKQGHLLRLARQSDGTNR